jgi:hypothetical protein
LRPAEADLIEIEIGVFWTDVMEHAGDGAANAVVETFRRVGMNEAAGIFPFRVANGVVGGEGFADRDK